MKKMFTLAFILALGGVCPVVAETTDTDLEALIAELNDSDEDETVAPVAEKTVTPAAEEAVDDVVTDVQE